MSTPTTPGAAATADPRHCGALERATPDRLPARSPDRVHSPHASTRQLGTLRPPKLRAAPGEAREPKLIRAIREAVR